MSYKIQPLAWLPNTNGYRFTGILKDGSKVPCKVVRGPDGIHRVQGAAFEDLKGWQA